MEENISLACLQLKTLFLFWKATKGFSWRGGWGARGIAQRQRLCFSPSSQVRFLAFPRMIHCLCCWDLSVSEVDRGLIMLIEPNLLLQASTKKTPTKNMIRAGSIPGLANRNDQDVVASNPVGCRSFPCLLHQRWNFSYDVEAIYKLDTSECRQGWK